jgi:hypothetical protein
MSAKTSAARRAAFFAALRATGNQTVAAERAKVSRSWVTLHRANDPAFRAAMEEAVAAAKAALSQAAVAEPGAGWRDQGGEELVARGSNGRVTQIARARLRQWTPRVEARFLSVLASSCNVKAACAEVGLSQESAYCHRKRWGGFARAWDQALEIGYDRVATALVAAAGAMLGDHDYEPETHVRMTSVRDAMTLLKMHQARVHGVGKLPGRRPRPRTFDEVRDSILRKLEMIERARLAEARERKEGVTPP